MEGLDFIEPLRIERVIEGNALVISPMTIAMLPKVLQHVEPLLGELGVLIATGVIDRLAVGEPTPDDLIDLATLLGHHGDAMLAAIALLARVDLAWVQDLLPDRAVSLAADVIRVNADFFGRAIQQATGTGGSLASLAEALDRKLSTAAAG